MTGLNSFNDHIIEICVILTDKDLNIIEEKGFEDVIHYPKEVMDKMDTWCTQHHGDSGLTKKVIESTNKLEDVEDRLLRYLKEHIGRERRGVLAGNSIHQDRLFLVREFPKVIQYLHYRQVDVSSIKEVGMRHNPKLMMQIPPKTAQHTARADILESIAELKWYYDNYLIPPNAEPPKPSGPIE